MGKLFRRQKTAYRHSLRHETMRLFVSVLCVLGILFLIASFIISQRTANDYRKKASEAAVNNVASYIATSVDTYNYISRLIMVNSRVVSFLHAEDANKSMSYEARMGMYEVLNMYNSISYIESVYIFRNDKQNAHTGKGEYMIDTGVEEWQRVLDARGSRLMSVDGNGMIMKTYGLPTLTFLRAIYDTNTQRLLGVLVMNISNECFDEVLNLQTGSNICILDADGSYLCGDSEMVDLYRDTYDDEISLRKVNYKGSKVVLAGKRALDSFTILGFTRDGRKAVPSETIVTMVIIFVAFTASTVISAGFIRRKITGPIMALDEAMDKTKSSGWMERVDIEMPDNEIGHLAETYNQTLDYLNELFGRLLQEEENMRMAELRVLQEQIKPHFLYNTLGTISYIAVEENAERAHDALETLGSFYRNFLSKGDREISFRRELAIIKDYLSLQKLRYGSSFDDEYDIDEDTLDVKVPKLILQPMVENSIYHGVRLKGEKCIIRVSAKNTEEGLHIIVYDTGVGMSQAQIDKLLGNEQPVQESAFGSSPNQPGSGFGLVGTIERIKYYCNRDDVVQIRSVEGEFTQIEILIPREIKNQ